MRTVYFYFCIIYTSMTHYDIFSICVQEEITKRERGRTHPARLNNDHDER